MHRYKLSKAGWSLGRVSAVDSNGRTNWIADAHTLIHLVDAAKSVRAESLYQNRRSVRCQFVK